MKPCPFCGGAARLISRSGFDYGEDRHHVECMTCNSKGREVYSEYRGRTYQQAKDEAARCWNGRTP